MTLQKEDARVALEIATMVFDAKPGEVLSRDDVAGCLAEETDPDEALEAAVSHGWMRPLGPAHYELTRLGFAEARLFGR